eukprot:TRINITY_DN3370_c0_g1_i1.p1 TRINITY_DN3370_c0_g1~~TRINITY_DN3370_c0_g1_i1.p1  ORF type:complete len:376 (+),score=79.16 TRINITY_DN3370_c0_g1_i1:70-1128(+)
MGNSSSSNDQMDVDDNNRRSFSRSSSSHKGNKKKRKSRKKKIFTKGDGLDYDKLEYDPDKPISDHFEITSKILGVGNYSQVKLGMNKKNEEGVAVKIINKDTIINRPEMLKNEVRILQEVDHPNIIKLYGIFDSETDDNVYLVMELVTGGELFDRIVEVQQYTEVEGREIMRQLLSAICYLHERGIAHRDLKPENLLLENNTENSPIKIADFGLSRVYKRETMMSTACGTPGYIAPEILKNVKYDKEVDLWSAGVIMYIILCGYPPFYDEEEHVLYEKIMEGQFHFHSPYWDGITNEAKDLISNLLVVDPEQRYTAEEALNAPWFTMDLRKAARRLGGIHSEFKTQLSNTWN